MNDYGQIQAAFSLHCNKVCVSAYKSFDLRIFLEAVFKITI